MNHLSSADEVVRNRGGRRFGNAQAAKGDDRFWEVDALRGVAVVMMVMYHLLYDLYYFGVTDVIFTQPFWFYFQRTTATLFIGLAGVSLALRWQQAKGRLRYRVLAKRGLQLIVWGMVISLATWFALGPELYIRFGILHFIGLAILLAYPFLRWRWLNLGFGIGLVSLGIWVQQFRFVPPWSYLFWLGLEPVNHNYVDFFPFLRWFGVVLIGIGIGNGLYRQGKRQFGFINLPLPWLNAGFSTLGRHSLAVYLLHQPVLLVLLLLAFWMLQ